MKTFRNTERRQNMTFPNSLLKRLVRYISPTISDTEALDLHHELMKYELYQRSERRKLVDEITNEVLKRISVSVDTEEAVNNINELKRALRDF